MNDFKKYFDLLYKKGLSPINMEKTVSNWSIEQMGDTIHELETTTPYINKKPSNITTFDFAVSGSLSGQGHPCSAIECRLDRVDQLARFAALYANKIVIICPLISKPPSKISDDIKKLFIDDLTILYYLRPLIESGIVLFTPRRIPLCKIHANEAKEKESLIFNTAKDIIKPLLPKISVNIEEFKDGTFLSLNGPEILFENCFHGCLYTGDMNKYKRKRKITHIMNAIKPTLVDVLWQNISSLRNYSNYLTSSELHLKLIQELNPELKSHNKALINGFSHSLPFLKNIDIKKLIDLRLNEVESFNVYRDSVTEALKLIEISNISDIREIFNDIIRPELNKIELTIKNQKTFLTDDLKRDLLVSFGFISIGLFSGLFSPELSKLLTALGGYDFIAKTCKDVHYLLKEPSEIKKNKYYFLWKIKKMSM